ncbi:hypothetical protein DVA86_28405 [Streptomyces armeniacus]|uniref:Uncharacterized protein n=1 Tax=Streptomyces armeniacus TaxID=83291 RepID=A0A345XWD1_9ACTN|nr:hypothetical protein [Streptomyces armeniacus]AXK35947.1 hypothetical protein DVA86_28405 [Streptomyces armeniacus]
MSARRGRLARLAATTLALGTAATLLGGCGIRSTSVPVDAGAAPSRVACMIPGGGETRAVPDGAAARVYLVCGSRVAPVHRLVRLPEKRPDFVRALLDELQDPPGPEEESAGFESAVPRDLKITEGRDGDPENALRLSTPLDKLPRYALAQIVCSYADTGIADDDGTVVLGGPADDTAHPLRRYECDTALRRSPEAAETAGTTV